MADFADIVCNRLQARSQAQTLYSTTYKLEIYKDFQAL